MCELQEGKTSYQILGPHMKMQEQDNRGWLRFYLLAFRLNVFQSFLQTVLSRYCKHDSYCYQQKQVIFLQEKDGFYFTRSE